MNKVKWQTFVRQAKGADITEIHVDREERAAAVLVKYNGKNRKGGRVVTGEWVVEKAGKDAVAVAAAIHAFLDRARKDFFVKREPGLSGDSFASKQEEEGGKARTIVGDTETAETPK